MISFETALHKILKHAIVLGAIKVPIEEASGRILQEDITSGIDMPPFDRSAMDGYAVNHSDIKKIPSRLRCIGIIQAGLSLKRSLKRGECAKIMTGAPLPKGADCVVMVEYTGSSRQGVEILRLPEEGENIFFRGEDFRRGQKVLEKGKRLYPSDVAVLAAVGKRYVKVTATPRVALLNTGAEIVPTGIRLSKNKIYNSNSPMLESLLKSDGIQPKALGVVGDNALSLRRAISKGLASDILLISGGVSMGDYDLVPEVLRSLGVKKIFHRVSIKPGKPIFFGIKGRTLVFGVPGNPVSNFVSYMIFVRAVLQKITGLRDGDAGFKEGIVKEEFHKKPGRRYFALSKILEKAGRSYLSPVDSRSSADTLSLSKADGIAMLDEKATVAQKGSKLQFMTWKTL